MYTVLSSLLHPCQCRLLHGHHDSEEEVYFPEIERRLGTHAMDANVDQHQAFLPQLVKFEEYLASVKAGEISYDSTALLNQVASFGEILMEHLHDVSLIVMLILLCRGRLIYEV